MKGTTIIELKDVKTGEVQRTVDHNYFTNALKHYFKPGGELAHSPFGSAAGGDWTDSLLGGIMLFDDDIVTEGVTDDPDIIYPPLGLNMTANGVRGVQNNADPTEMGSYNEVESGWQADGTLRMTWDWSTSFGNGTIKSVCLCPTFAAFEGIGNHSLTSRTPPSGSYSCANYNNSRERSTSGMVVAVHDNIVYSMDNGSYTSMHAQQAYIDISNKTEMTFNLTSLAENKVDLRSTNSAGVDYGTAAVTLPSALQNTEMYIRKWQQRGLHLYLLCSNGTAYTDTFYILDVNLETKEVANTWTVVPSTLGATESGFGRCGITDKYMMYNEICVDFRNSTAVSVTYPTGVTIGDDVISIGDRFYTATWGFEVKLLLCIDPSTGDAYPVNGVGANDMDYSSWNFLTLDTWNIGYDDNPVLYYIERHNTRSRMPRFLSTINNLESAVVKTADKTMKVTYVIDFEPEE